MRPEKTWMRDEDRTFRLVPPFDLEPRKTALVVIDMQKGSTHPDHGLGPMWKEHYPDIYANYYGWMWETVIPAHQRLLAFFRENGLRVIYLRVGPLTSDGSDMPLRPPPDLGTHEGDGPRHWTSPKPGTESYEILDEIAPLPEELVISKNTSSGFTGSQLDQVLRNTRVECLVLTGIGTPACVLSTAMDGADRGFKCVMVEDACGMAAADFELHDAALRIFYKIYGRVELADTVCAELARAL